MTKSARSTKNKVMSSVSNSFKFANEKVKSNLIDYIRRENIEIDDSDLRKILFMVESTIEQSFTLSSDSISKSLEEM